MEDNECLALVRRGERAARRSESGGNMPFTGGSLIQSPFVPSDFRYWLPRAVRARAGLQASLSMRWKARCLSLVLLLHADSPVVRCSPESELPQPMVHERSRVFGT